MSDSEEVLISSTPPELVAIAQDTTEKLLPKKSFERYLVTYKNFITWRDEHNTTSFSENVMMAYFSYLRNSKNFKPNTMWAYFSMISKVIQIKHNVNIQNYSKLIAFIKKENVGYMPKKSKILEEEHIFRYLADAPDNEHLHRKLILALGISGGLRRQEIHNIKLKNVVPKGEKCVIVQIPDTKGNISKSFAMTGALYDVYEKFMEIRKRTHATSDKLLIHYANGQCKNQNIGIHTVGKIPQIVATFLGLEDPQLYTSHCLRRSGTSVLANSGADMDTIQRYGAWKSKNIAETYVVESVENKKRLSDRINHGIDRFAKKPRIEPMTSTAEAPETNNNVMDKSIEYINDKMPILTQYTGQPEHMLLQKETSSVNRVIATRTKSLTSAATSEPVEMTTSFIEKSKSHVQEVRILK